MVIGSAVQVHILKQYHRYSSLLPAAAATMTAMPAVEAAAATIGHQGRTSTTPTTSASAAAMSACTTATVRSGNLSAASRQPTKSQSFSEE